MYTILFFLFLAILFVFYNFIRFYKPASIKENLVSKTNTEIESNSQKINNLKLQQENLRTRLPYFCLNQINNINGSNSKTIEIDESSYLNNILLNFSINPNLEGKTGPTGPRGPIGSTGPKGETGTIGKRGTHPLE